MTDDEKWQAAFDELCELADLVINELCDLAVPPAEVQDIEREAARAAGLGA